MFKVKIFKDLFQRYRRPGDIVFAVAFLLFAIFLLSQMGVETKWVKRTKWFAQPAFWPKLAVVGMVVFGALHLISSLVSPRIPGRLKEIGFWLQSLEYVAYFLIYVLLVPKLGYLPSTVIFALFLSFRCGFRAPKELGMAVVFAICVVVLFRGFLQVKIPAGAIYEYLPDSLRIFAFTYL